ncbi:hypothetical protein EZV62_013465 [Acer yangbiense]|uniref:PPM-type phosphatase domain-containing protein n=1 Tax=Acer yangbiense TaxID=1000413 RepID=A0A5C7I120_9ROSI|nr:hypothetical protein EZV62_013465 [Acer yangbiense]
MFASFVPLYVETCSILFVDLCLNGRMLVVANAGDCRAVLCGRGKAIEMSRDHKPLCIREKLRIEASGGSQNAMDFARRRLQEHNDQVTCSKDLVDEALKRKSGDNLSAVVV